MEPAPAHDALLNCGVVVIEELVILGDLKADYELPG